MYYSEYGQDEWLNKNVFKGRRGGTFIEIGALDGVLHSNTLFFEKELEWKGTLVEANPEEFLKIMKGDRECGKILGACSSLGGINRFSIVSPVTGWGGLAETMEEKHLQRIREVCPKTTDFLVATITLDDILDLFPFHQHFDYISIDVEGAEKDVVSGSVLLAGTNFGVIGIENNYETDAVEKVMKETGFVKFHRQGVDDFYRKA